MRFNQPGRDARHHYQQQETGSGRTGGDLHPGQETTMLDLFYTADITYVGNVLQIFKY